MSDIICVTNRKLCDEDLTVRIEKLAACRPAGIILREKDLSKNDYRSLAEQALEICRRYGVPCILHSFADAAAELNAEAIHLPLHMLREAPAGLKQRFKTIGVSCHSVEDVLEAEKIGCNYVTAGHVFETDCKKGLAGRGVDFLKKICEIASVPVFAIGGIDADRAGEVRRAGASGICVMSGAMRCEDPEAYIAAFR